VKFIIPILALLLIGAPVALWVSSKPAAITADPVKVIGYDTPVKIRIDSPHGLRRLDVDVEQNGKSYSATSVETSARRFLIQQRSAHHPDCRDWPQENSAAARWQGPHRHHRGRQRHPVCHCHEDY
jgi:hypothetical protein